MEPAAGTHERRAHVRWHSLIAASAAALVLVSCSPPVPVEQAPTTAHTPATGDPVVVNALTLPTSYDPADTDDPYALRIAGLIQRGLYRFDAKGKGVLEVAESVETADDRVFTVTLAPGWRFSNGEAVTADSFVDAWSRAADPAHPRLHRDLFAPILGFTPDVPVVQSTRAPAAPTGARATSSPSSPTTSAASVPTAAPAPDGRSPRLPGLQVIDARTFTITLDRPRPDFVQRLAHAAFMPLPDVAFTDPQAYGRSPVGNGPYRLDGEWTSTGTVRLRPDPIYTGIDGARNAGIDFRVYTDPDLALRDMEDGRLDILDVLPTTALTDYRATFAERAVNQPVGARLDIVFPTGSAPWTGTEGADRRRAISLAVDREALAREELAGTSAPATDLATPLVEGHSREMCNETCHLDPANATKALTEAGGMPGTMTLAYAADTDGGAVARAVCADVVEHLEIACTPRAHPTTAALREAVRSGAEPGPYLGRYQMDYPLLENFLLPRFTPGAPTNDSGFRDAGIAAALDRADATATPERIPRFQSAETRLLEALPVVPLLNLNATTVSSTAVRDVHIDVFGAPGYADVQRP